MLDLSGTLQEIADAYRVADGVIYPSTYLGESLRDAMVAVLDSPTGQAVVVDDGGTPRGTITAAGILAASRRSLAPEATG